MNLNFSYCEFGDEEREAVNKVLQGNWLASGPEVEAFEAEFAAYIGTKYAISVNSGSSANLLSLASLGLAPGSKVLTGACGFPATLAPIIHLRLVPVLIDYDRLTNNVDLNHLDKNVSAMIVAHTLGNPLDMKNLMEFADRHAIYVIEDCCEAVGSRYDGKQVGSFGKCGTFSFYPAHQMTAEGTGGMITTNDLQIARKCRSLRDWGKIWDWDTKLGNNVTKYTEMIDGIPYYKHYTYETVGYNAKLSETAAAFGRCQIKRLDGIREKRIENYAKLYAKLEPLDLFYLVKADQLAEPSWFGFTLTLKNPGLRESLGDYLETRGVRTRPFFAGNITRHKPFQDYYREFPVADKLMRDSMFIGIGQWLGDEELNFITETIKQWNQSL